MKLLDFIHNTKAQAALAFVIIIGVPVLLVFGHLKETTEGRLLDIMYLAPSFYFIASKSGADKDKAIANLTAPPAQTTN
ncbi:hypothetical protein [Mucilaginibacter sp.]|uniref:hypothetical protein n=1 Tax=Mucilaginibacter sp. TaxID=1882438 RepID=UPI0025FF49C0|nr:hypothetical protein [Mucilaginibacter sp.]